MTNSLKTVLEKLCLFIIIKMIKYIIICDLRIILNIYLFDSFYNFFPTYVKKVGI